MYLIERYIVNQTLRLVLTIVGFLIFIFTSYSAQRYLTDAANGTLALGVVVDIVFYKVLIALEMLLPVALYVAVGVALGQLYNDSEITAIYAAGAGPVHLYKAVILLAVPLGILVMLLSVYARPWAYGQIYQLEQQSQSELDVHHLMPKKFNVNDHGRMVLADSIDPLSSVLSDVLIYTPSGSKSKVYRAQKVTVTDPSPTSPAVLLQSGTSYELDHQGKSDSDTAYRHLNLQLEPVAQSKNFRRKSASVSVLARSTDPADSAELQWRESRGISAILMALLAIPLSRIKPRQGRFATLLPLTLLFTAIFYGGNLSRTLVANGMLPVIPGVWIIPLLMLLGLAVPVIREGSLLYKGLR